MTHQHDPGSPHLGDRLDERPRRSQTALLFAGLLTLIQLFRITARSFWADEAYVGLIVTEPWSRFFQKLHTDIHHPLYITVARVWSMASGNSEFALRLLSVLALICAFILFWRIIAETDGERVALWTTLFFIFSPAVLLYGRMARYYSLSFLLFILAIFLLLHWVKNSHPGRTGFFYFLVLTASWFLSEPLGVVAATHFLVVPRDSPVRRKSFLIWLLSTCLYGFWFWFWKELILGQTGTGPSPLEPMFYSEWALKVVLPLYQLVLGESVPPLPLIFISAMFAAFLCVAGIYRPMPRVLLFCLIWLPALIALATFPIRVGIDFIPARVFFLLPALSWLLGRGLTRFRLSWRAPLALCLLCPMAIGMAFTYTGIRSLTSTYVTPWREVTQLVIRLSEREDWVLADEVPLLYYWKRFAVSGPRVAIITRDTNPEDIMDALAENFPPRIFVFLNPRDITGGKITAVLDWVTTGYDLVRSIPVVVEASSVSQIKRRFVPFSLPIKRELRIYQNIRIAEDPFAIDRLLNLPEIPVIPAPQETGATNDQPSLVPDEAPAGREPQ
ncbi:MAG: hypothetical protein V2G42_08215 [bacterium JZ-2024 1]